MLAGFHRAVLGHDVAQCGAVDVFHDDVGQRAGGGLGFAGVVYRDDGWVAERRGVLRLAAKPQIEGGVSGQVRAQHLDRHVTVQPVVTGTVNL